MSKLSAFATTAAAATLATTIMTTAPTDADAATIIQGFGNSSYYHSEGMGEGKIELTKFDPTQGTLNSITFELFGRANVDFSNPAPQEGMAEFKARGYLDIISADTNTVFMNWNQTLTTLQDTMNPYYALDFPGNTVTMTLTSPSDLSNFIGSGSYTFKTKNGVEIISTDGAPVGPAFANHGNPGFRVSMNFTAAANPVSPVPEPGMWALMITGFGLAGVMIRNNKKAANDASAPGPKPTV